MIKYFKIWLKTSLLSLETDLMSRTSSLFFVIGKIIRFYLFLVLLYVVLGNQAVFKGYQLEQMIVFFLIFNLFDILGQLLFRGIYWFRNSIINGSFDLVLVKPINPLFSVLTDKTDFLDFPLLLIIVYLLVSNRYFQILGLPMFALLSLISLICIASIHIIVAALGIITTEVDHTIWIYRDLSTLARVPIDIYHPLIRHLLTFLIPIAIIFTFPAKALMGILNGFWLLMAFAVAFIFFSFSILFWQFALKKYSSASS